MEMLLQISLVILLVFFAFFLEVIAMHVVNFYFLDERHSLGSYFIVALVAKIGLATVALIGPFIPLSRHTLYPVVFGWVFATTKMVYFTGGGDKEVDEKEARWPTIIVLIGDAAMFWLIGLIF